MSRADTVTVALAFAMLFARALKPRNEDLGWLLTAVYAAAVFYWFSVVYTGRIWHV